MEPHGGLVEPRLASMLTQHNLLGIKNRPTGIAGSQLRLVPWVRGLHFRQLTLAGGTRNLVHARDPFSFSGEDPRVA
jgi:hypothetical protein